MLHAEELSIPVSCFSPASCPKKKSGIINAEKSLINLFDQQKIFPQCIKKIHHSKKQRWSRLGQDVDPASSWIVVINQIYIVNNIAVKNVTFFSMSDTV